eukprot:817483-Amphidinium_carterae.1
MALMIERMLSRPHVRHEVLEKRLGQISKLTLPGVSPVALPRPTESTCDASSFGLRMAQMRTNLEPHIAKQHSFARQAACCR